MPQDKTPAILAHLPLFREASDEEVARILQGVKEVRLDRGQLLFQKGSPANGFYLVDRKSVV